MNLVDILDYVDSSVSVLSVLSCWNDSLAGVDSMVHGESQIII